MALFCLCLPVFFLSSFLSHHLLASVPVKWTVAASQALRSFLTRFCGLFVLILWCIMQSFPSTVNPSCCRQSQAGESWPRLLWTEFKRRMDTTTFCTLALVIHILFLIQNVVHLCIVLVTVCKMRGKVSERVILLLSINQLSKGKNNKIWSHSL